MRNKSTRIISAALAAAMMLSVCPVSAFATYRQAEAEKAVAAYAAQNELDEENGGTIKGLPSSSDSEYVADRTGTGYVAKNGSVTIEAGWTLDPGENAPRVYQLLNLKSGGNNTIKSGYYDYVQLSSNATISGGTFLGSVILLGNSNSITGGVFQGFINPDYNAKSNKLTAPYCTINRIIELGGNSLNNYASVVGTQKITVSYPSEVSGWDVTIGGEHKTLNDLPSCTATSDTATSFSFTMPAGKDVTLTAKALPTGDAPEFDNGFPTESDGGKKDVKYSNWKYEAASNTLTLLDGDFALNGSSVACNITVGGGKSKAALKNSSLSGSFELKVSDNGTVESGSYSCNKITNNGTINGGDFKAAGQFINGTRGYITDGTFTCGEVMNSHTISGGVFDVSGYFHNTDQIDGGTFKAGAFTNTNVIYGGIFTRNFGETGSSAKTTKITLNDFSNLKVNGLTLSDSQLYIVTHGETKQTLELAYSGETTTYSWNVKIADQSYGYLKAGKSATVFGAAEASVSTDGKTLTIKASSIPDQIPAGASIELAPVHKPTYFEDDLTVKFGSSTITSSGSIGYDPANKGFSVMRGDAELNDAKLTLTDGSDEPIDIEAFDGKPGSYKLTVAFENTDAHTESSVQYVISIKKGFLTNKQMSNFIKVENGDGKFAYDKASHTPTVTPINTENLPEGMNKDDIEVRFFKLNADHNKLDDSTPDDGYYAEDVILPGDYITAVRFPESDNYEESVYCYGFTVTYDDEDNPIFDVDKFFTIEPGELADGTLTYDPKDQELISTDPDIVPADFDTEVTYTSDATGKSYSPKQITTAPAGYYTVHVIAKNKAGLYKDVDITLDEKYEVEKYTLNEDNFVFTYDKDVAYDGEAHGVAVSVSEEHKPLFDVADSDISVTYYDAEGTELKGAPTNAGKYTYTVKASNSNYKEFTYTGNFEITKRTDAISANEIHFNGLTDEQKEQLKAKLSVKKAADILKDSITTEKGISVNDLEFTFYGENGKVEDFIRKKGTYTFTVTVKDSENYAATVGLTSDDWKFDVTAEPQPISFAYPAESTTVPDDIANRFTWTAKYDDANLDAAKLSATVGTNVTLSWTEKDMEYSITGLTATYTEDGEEKTAEGKFDKDSKTFTFTFTFEMPDAPVSINVSVNNSFPIVDPVDPDTDEPINPEPSFPGQVGDDEGFAPAVAVVAGTAALGGAAYLVGTQVYLETVLPAGAAIPHTRAQLAQLLWTNAGKPAPKAVLADTSDTATAIAWCVENNLISAEGKPESYVTRVQVIKAWNAAQNLNKAN